MTINRLRRNGLTRAIALAVAALTSSAPANAVEAGATPRLQSLVEAVSALDETVNPAAGSVIAPIAPIAPSQTFQALGQGEASYYGNELAGNRTATGERFLPNGLTAAHRTLPLGSKVRVTNLANGRSVIVRVNDRGPFVRSRLIDVSLGAAREIRMVGSGKAQVKLELLRTIA
jgi:rare lipoprotein A